MIENSEILGSRLFVQIPRRTMPRIRYSRGEANTTPAEAKTEESAILLLARNGHHIPGVIGPKRQVHEDASHE